MAPQVNEICFKFGDWGSLGAIVHKCRVEFRRERTGLKYAVPGQRKIRRDKRKPEKFTGAQGQYTHIFLLWEFHSSGNFWYFGNSTRQANFCTLGIPLARQIFYFGNSTRQVNFCTLGILAAGQILYFGSSTRQANFCTGTLGISARQVYFCTLGIPLTRQIFVLWELLSPGKFLYFGNSTRQANFYTLGIHSPGKFSYFGNSTRQANFCIWKFH